MLKMRLLLLLLLLATHLSASIISQPQYRENCQEADILFVNGQIITMDNQYINPRAVAVKNGKIINVLGTMRKNLFCNFGQNTKVINLKGKALIPGFVDAHSHFSLTAVAQSLGFSISPPPFGSVTTIAQMLQNAKDYIINNNIPPGQTVYSEGYSDYQVAQHRHPTRFELDWISTEHPIMFKHFSAHVVVANSLAIESLGITEESTPPPGGIFDRFPNGSLTGVFKEYAILPFTVKYGKSIAELTPEQIQRTAESYFKVGVTTAQDISFSLTEPTVFKTLGETLPIDINSYHWIASANLTTLFNVVTNYTTSRVKHRGAKFILDGSIQAYTALLSRPFWVPQAQQYDNLDNYTYDDTRSCATEICGENNFPYQSLLRSFFATIQNQNLDILAHCNGDAALDSFLDALSFTRNTTNKTDARFVVIHAQTAREDQLDAMIQLEAVPSFFSPHIYYWGDQHYKYFLGPERANRMNPAKSAARRGLRYTLHNDSPVIMNDIFDRRNTFIQIMEAAINRRTAEGRVLGEDQKLTPYEALAGVTINSAWQVREQDIKGSITPGKIADLVILSDDPLSKNTQKFKNLQVIATLKEGRLVYGNYP